MTRPTGIEFRYLIFNNQPEEYKVTALCYLENIDHTFAGFRR